MQSALKKISAKYPPGKGLSDNQKNLEPILKQLAYEDKFAHKHSTL